MIIIGSMFMLLGLLVLILGIFIWKKQLIRYISSQANVQKTDVKAFTKGVGQSTVGFGLSAFILGLAWSMGYIPVGFLLFLLSFAVSLFFYFKNQKRYNK